MGTRDIRRMPKRTTPIFMPIFVGLLSGGVTIGLVALLECGAGDVIETAVAGKDAEGARNADVVEFAVVGKNTEVTGFTVTAGVVFTFDNSPAQAENPK